MSVLLTQCPHCNTSFRVSEVQQGAAAGLVRCGSCLAVFSALDNEIRIKPPFLEHQIEQDAAIEESLQDEIDSSEASSTPQEDSPEEAPAPVIVFTMEDESSDARSDEHNQDELEYPSEENIATPIEDLPEELLEELAEELMAQQTESHAGDQPSEQNPAFQAETIGQSASETTAAPTAVEEALELMLQETERFEPEDSDEDFAIPDQTQLASEPPTPQQPAIESELEEQQLAEAEEEQAAYAFVQEVHDVNLGDMRIDELEDDAEQPDETDDPHEHEDDDIEEHVFQEPVTAQSPAVQDKTQVREYLSSIADDEATLERADDIHLDELDEEPLTFTARKQRSAVATFFLLTANLLLIAGLFAQWLYWNRSTLDTHPRFSALAPLACQLFSCPEPPPPPVSSELSWQQLLVRTHPRLDDALEVSFIFNNDATTPRPFPNLELAFSDLNNQVLANRLFTPSEYLPAELQQFDEMPPQTSVQVTLELADPGKDAVNYNISFHDPAGAAE